MNHDLMLLVCRVLLVVIFPISGYYKVVGWPGITEALSGAGLPFPYLLGAVGTGAEIVLPILVIIGLFTRWACLGLVIYIIVATCVGHPIWRVPPEAFFENLMSVLKNAAMVGGLLLIAMFGPGRWAVDGRPTRGPV